MYSENGQVVFTVTDHGIGIPGKDTDRVFDPFHRGTNVGSIRGTGLGLPLAREFVRLHGGDITFETRENEGTTFYVSLPLNNYHHS